MDDHPAGDRRSPVAARALIDDLVGRIDPHDDREAADRDEVHRWIRSGAPLFRTRAPAEPPRHLVVYFALLDDARRTILLVDHVRAGLWLLPGGHVDVDEDPRVTVVREAAEELGVAVTFHPRRGTGDPFFLTVTGTRGPDPHTDVTLWFLLTADQSVPLTFDHGEFHHVEWFPLDAPVAWDGPTFDPQMHRFVAKLAGGERARA